MNKSFLAKSVLIILLFVSVRISKATLPINPQPGENINQLLQRTADGIDCGFADTFTTLAACCPCDVSVTQEMIPFTITQPGVYCLVEDVLVSAGNAITINSSDVAFDLENHLIDGTSGGAIGIRIEAVERVEIKNGRIKGMGGNGISINDVNSYTLSNLKINNCLVGINIDTSSSSLTTTNGFLKDIQIRDIITRGLNIDHSIGFIIENVSVQEVASFEGFLIDAGASDGVFNNCSAQNCGAQGFSNFGNNIIFNQCISINNASGFTQSSSAATNNQFIECRAFDNTVLGFSTIGNDTIYRDCISSNNGAQGFFINENASGNAANCILIGCIAEANNNIGFSIGGDYCYMRECIADNNTFGFVVVSGAGSPVQGCRMEFCEATNNTTDGFRTSDAIGPILRNCTATNNTVEGFSLLDTSNNRDGIIENCVSNGNGARGFRIDGDEIVLRNCTATNNTTDGFDFASTTTNCKLMSSCAMNNAGFGIQDNSSNSGNRFFNNVSLNNTSGDYDPLATFVPPVGLLVGTGDITAMTGFWANIKN